MHFLQSPLWGQFKSRFGWTMRHVPLLDGAVTAQILYRRLLPGLTLAYVPKGPAIDWTDAVQAKSALAELKAAARRRGNIFLKIEPDAPTSDALQSQFQQAGFVSGKTVQPVNTIVIDIAPPEADILAAMKSKTRYNIRLAAKKEVQITAGTAIDLDTFYELSQVTSQRDNFGVHALPYYQALFECFPPENRALLLAHYQDEPLAALIALAWQGRAYYLYGASSNQHRNRMPTYLLQWEAIRWAKAAGCHTYDLWGIPDASPEELEAQFSSRSDGLWGVYRFKRGFGGRVERSTGAFDYVYNRPLYALFSKLLEKRSA